MLPQVQVAAHGRATRLVKVARGIPNLVLIAGCVFAAACRGSVHDVAPDPAIIADPAGGYYIFGTGDGLPFWHSSDLINWEPIGTVFPDPQPSWTHDYVAQPAGCWAPDISFHDGAYYLYYAVSHFGTQESVIGLAVNKTLDPRAPGYRWDDHGAVIESAVGKDDFNAIDPALYADRDGKWYLFFGSFFAGIKLLALDSHSGKPLGKNQPMVTVAARPGHRIPSIEGAYVIDRGGYHYLFVSWGLCCLGPLSTYEIVVGRSRSIGGPYLDRCGRNMVHGGGTRVLASSGRWRGPGHNSVLTTSNGQWLVYHTYDLFNLGTIHGIYWSGRRLQLRPMKWDGEGWPVAGTPLPMTVSQPGAR